MNADEDLDQTGRFTATRPDGVRVSIGASVLVTEGGEPVGVPGAEVSSHVTTKGADRSSTLDVSEMTPLTQIGFTWGVPTGAYVQQASALSASITGATGYVDISTGTNASGFAALRSTRILKYRDGQDIVCQYLARFGTPTADCVQIVGPQTAGDGVGIGYDGTRFGVFRKVGGVREIRTLTLSAGTSGAGNVTVTLAGVARVVAISGVLGAPALASALAAADYTTTGAGWSARANGSTVVFVCQSAGPQAGAYSVSGSGAAGSFEETTAGVTGADSWTYADAFSVDPLDGTGASGMNVDPTTVTGWMIEYTATEARFYVRPPTNGDHALFHVMTASGTDAGLFGNPTFPLQAIAANLGATTNTTLRVYSMAAHLAGPLRRLGARRGVTSAKTGVGTTYVPVLTVTAKNAFGSPARAFNHPIYIPTVTLAVEGNQAARFEVVVNAALTEAQFGEVAPGGATLLDTSATAMTGGIPVAAAALSKSGSVILDLSDLDLELYPSGVESVTVAARSESATTDVFAALSYVEDR